MKKILFFSLVIGFLFGCTTTVGILYILSNNYEINYNKKKGLELTSYTNIVSSKNNINQYKDEEEEKILMMKEDKEIDKETDKMVAEYIFDSLKEAMKFHAQMTVKGYLSILERVAI